jgi:hypothetical protein
MSYGNGAGTLEHGVASAIAEIARDGRMPAYVERFIERGEIVAERFTPEIRDAMVHFLVDRGVFIPDEAAVMAGEFDEHFVAAYENAIQWAGGGVDPVDVARRPASAAAVSWDFSVDGFDDLPAQGIIHENIKAAGAVDYVYELGERLGVFRIADALVLNWSAGAIDVVDGTAARRLYRYLRLRDERSTAEERGMLYRRVLSKSSVRVLDRMTINAAFPALWHRLMSEVARFIDKTERVTEGTSERSPVSRSGIYQATRELQHNLTDHCTGMAHMQVRELYAQLQECFEILRDPEIVAHFGGTRRKSMWTVLEHLSRSEFGHVPNIAAYRQLAVHGNNVFRWVADFNEAPGHDRFVEFLESAEAYILASSVVSPDGSEFDDDEAGDDDDGFGDFDDFDSDF